MTGLIWAETFTGTNGSAPSTTRFVTSVVGTGSTIDIQGNELRLLTGTTNPSESRAICRDDSSTNFNLGVVEVLALYDPGATLQQQFPAIILRTTNDWDGSHPHMPTSGYAFEIDPSSASSNVLVYKHVSGTFTAISSLATFAATASTKFFVRVQAVGTALRMRIWNNGSAEPTTWLIDVTDASLASGGVQVRNFSAAGANRTTLVDSLSVDAPIQIATGLDMSMVVGSPVVSSAVITVTIGLDMSMSVGAPTLDELMPIQIATGINMSMTIGSPTIPEGIHLTAASFTTVVSAGDCLPNINAGSIDVTLGVS